MYKVPTRAVLHYRTVAIRRGSDTVEGDYTRVTQGGEPLSLHKHLQHTITRPRALAFLIHLVESTIATECK